MSVSASLDVLFRDSENPPSAVVSALVGRGWVLTERGGLEVALTDLGEWVSRDGADADSVLDELDKCWERRRDCAVALYRDGSAEGGQCLFHSDRRTVSFLATINRRTVVSTGLTDANWYLERFVTPLRDAGMDVVSFRWEEIA